MTEVGKRITSEKICLNQLTRKSRQWLPTFSYNTERLANILKPTLAFHVHTATSSPNNLNLKSIYPTYIWSMSIYNIFIYKQFTRFVRASKQNEAKWYKSISDPRLLEFHTRTLDKSKFHKSI